MNPQPSENESPLGNGFDHGVFPKGFIQEAVKQAFSETVEALMDLPCESPGLLHWRGAVHNNVGENIELVDIVLVSSSTDNVTRYLVNTLHHFLDTDEFKFAPIGYVEILGDGETVQGVFSDDPHEWTPVETFTGNNVREVSRRIVEQFVNHDWDCVDNDYEDWGSDE